jgi:hypothetical protein
VAGRRGEERPDWWWADEIIAHESDWAPAGQRIYLTFLVDPQDDVPNRPKGNGVWAVMATRTRPGDRRAGEPLMSLGRGWKDRLEEFVAEVNRLRSDG